MFQVWHPLPRLLQPSSFHSRPFRVFSAFIVCIVFTDRLKKIKIITTFSTEWLAWPDKPLTGRPLGKKWSAMPLFTQLFMGAAVAQEWVIWSLGWLSDHQRLLSLCRKVLRRDAEPWVAPDGQASALHGVAISVWVCVNGWMRSKVLLPQFFFVGSRFAVW